MTNRSDLDVALSRIESLEREKRALAEQNALLKCAMQPQPKRVESAPPPSVVSSPVETDADEDSWVPWLTTLLVAILAIATAAIVMTTGQT